jgi:nucleoside phosphorylase
MRCSEAIHQVGTREMRFVTCACPEVGNAASAMTATKASILFRPRIMIMTGICAGIEADIGDIVVAETSLHYESGKYTESEGGQAVFLQQPKYQPASPKIIEAIKRFKIDRADAIGAIVGEWRGAPTVGKFPEVHIGPVASGAAVIENNSIVEKLVFRDRKLVGLEMESYGMYLTGEHSVSLPCEYIVIKGACDKARPPKTNGYQKYAAYLSAMFTYRFLEHEANIPGGLLS